MKKALFQAVNTEVPPIQTSVESARKALQLPHFNDFFTHFEKIIESHERKTLLSEAITVAARLRSPKLLTRLADLVAAEKFDEHPHPLVSIVQHLIKLEEYHTAIGVVSLYSNINKNSGDFWYTLCEDLLNNQQIEYVDFLYSHLKTDYEQRKIALQALPQIDLPYSPQHWFKWFFRYLSGKSNISDYSYGNRDYINVAWEFVTNHEHFSTVLPWLTLSNPNAAQTQFLTKICLHFLSTGAFAKAELLFQAMPEILQWPQQIYQALNDENFFHAFDHAWFRDSYLVSYKMQETLFNKALQTVFTRHQHTSLADITTTVLQLFRGQERTYRKQELMERFCDICLEHHRYDIVLHFVLNDLVEEFAPTGHTLLRLLDYPLENDQYRSLLKKTTPWPKELPLVLTEPEEKKHFSVRLSYEAEENLSFLRKIPQHLVLEEHTRRYPSKKKKNPVTPAVVTMDEKLKTLPNNSCSSKHPLHYLLKDKISQNIKDNKFDEALFYAQKLVASKERDKYLKAISLCLGRNNQLTLAQQVCNIIQQRSSVWKKWPQQLQNKDAKKTLEWLCSEELYDIHPVIQLYIERLFAQKPEKEALEIVLQSPVLKQPNLGMENIYYNRAKEGYFHYPSQQASSQNAQSAPTPTSTSSVDLVGWRDYSVAGFILYHFIIQFSNNPFVFDKLKELKETNITGFETALLYHYFCDKDWESAIHLINLFGDGEKTSYFSDKYSYFKKTWLNYFNFVAERSSANIEQLLHIKEERIRWTLLEIILSTWIPNSVFDNPDYETHRESILKIINGFTDSHTKESLTQKWVDKANGKITSGLFETVEKINEASVKLYFIQQCVYLSLLEPDEIIFSKARVYLEENPSWQFLISESLKIKEDYTSVYRNLLSRILTIPELFSQSKFLLNDFLVRDGVGERIFQVIEKLLVESVKHALNPWAVYQFLLEQRNHYHYDTDTYHQRRIKSCHLSLEKICLEQLITLAKSNSELASTLVDYVEISPQTLSEYRQYEYTSDEKEKVLRLQQYLLNQLLRTLPPFFIDKLVKHILASVSHPLTKFPSALASVFYNLREEKSFALAAELFLLMTPFYYQDIKYHWQTICDHWILMKESHMLLSFLNKLEEILMDPKKKAYGELREFGSSKCAYITRLIITLIEDNKMESAEKIYTENLNTASEGNIKNLLTYLIEKNYLIFAHHLVIRNIYTAEHAIYYRQAILNKHFERLSTWIGEEYAYKLKQAYHDLISFFKKNVETTTKIEANTIKNQLITTLKNLLDKAFLAYYVKTFQHEPPKKYLLCNFPAPVNEQCRGKTSKEKFDNFLKLFDMQNLQQSLLYPYLLAIQPADNPDYSWLAELRRMRNDETHAESYLPEKPVVNGRELDMQVYLPQAIEGIEKILIKLFQPQMTILQLDQLTLANLLPITAQTVDTLAPYFKVDSLSAALPALPSQPERKSSLVTQYS